MTTMNGAGAARPPVAWPALAAAAFSRHAAVLFGPEAATDLFQSWTRLPGPGGQAATLGGME